MNDDTNEFFAPPPEQQSLFSWDTPALPTAKVELPRTKLAPPARVCEHCREGFDKWHLGRWRKDVWFCSAQCKREHRPS